MRIFYAIIPCGASFSHRPLACGEFWTLFPFFIPTSKLKHSLSDYEFVGNFLSAESLFTTKSFIIHFKFEDSILASLSHSILIQNNSWFKASSKRWFNDRSDLSARRTHWILINVRNTHKQKIKKTHSFSDIALLNCNSNI